MTSIEVHKNRDSTLGKMYWGSPVQLACSWVHENTVGRFSEIYKPSSDKLLPDWGDKSVYGDIPPGTPAPPLLILDVERTLIGSVYDAKSGMKHVKRPGADELIRQLSTGYYEVVLFCENDIATMDSVLVALDKEGRCHKLGGSAAEMRDNVLFKRLDYMNRDVRKIIVIDDSEEAVSLFPRNALLVKPYTDVYDKDDRVLFDLIPLLHAIVQEGATDFRATLDDLGTRDAEEAATEYLMRKLQCTKSLIDSSYIMTGAGVSEAKRREMTNRNVGLGGLLRGGRKSQSTVSDIDDYDDDRDAGVRRSRVKSAAEIVGDDPAAVPKPKKAKGMLLGKETETVSSGSIQKKKGGMFEWLDKATKEKEEYERIKAEKMQEIHMKRMMEKNKEQELKSKQVSQAK